MNPDRGIALSSATFSGTGSAMALDVKHELDVLKKAHKRICKSKKSAQAYLVRAGFITPEGRLTDRYK